MSTQPPHRRGARVLRPGIVLIAFGGICAVIMAAFDLGVMHGAAAPAGVLVIYSVPATLFNWPRITLAVIAELLCGIARAVASFFAALFDW